MTSTDSVGEIHYIGDKAGNQLEARALELDGQKLYHPVSFANLQSLIDNIEHFKERPDDIWICAYPKSGTHWLNEILNQLIHGRASQHTKCHFMLEPCVSIDDFETADSPRIINTHVPWQHLSPQIKKSKIVCIIRNPLSVALSYFHHITALPQYSYKGSSKDFIESFAEEIYSFYGSWFDHAKTFYDASKENKNIHLLFYEEIKLDPKKSLSGLCEFLGLFKSEEDFEVIIEQTSISKMRTHFMNYTHGVALGNKPADFITRKGEIDEWKSHISANFTDKFMQKYKEELQDYPEIMERVKL